ncbi:acetate kinase [Eggerthellaceae bacterium zg-997]|nr:acetate kinase [Eggerthellaceae bacterium zg-997]
MNILVVNAGSSSLKYQLIDVERQKVLAKGLCERVGTEESSHKHGIDDNEVVISQPMKNHEVALGIVLQTLTEGPHAPLDDLSQIRAVGHRVVQGGKYFASSALIDDGVIARIEELAELAPLHNRAALSGIQACRTLMPGTPMVAVFDTSFFHSLPEHAHMYPIPYELSQKHSIRRYGAHGTSHRYIAERAAAVMDERLRDLKLITCHLGNGCSITAIDHGAAVDTSMGLTPLEGLMMGTRCGSIDPAIVLYLMTHEGYTPAQMDDVMNRQSGLLGVSGISNDLRTIRTAAEQGDERAILAYEMYAASAKKHIGQYIAVMGGVDAIVLAGGVGENCDRMRRMIFEGMQPLGIVLDEARNRERGYEREISTDESAVRIIIIPTDEEYMIAQDTYNLVTGAVAV